jgi:hypothetical protein
MCNHTSATDDQPDIEIQITVMGCRQSSLELTYVTALMREFLHSILHSPLHKPIVSNQVFGLGG